MPAITISITGEPTLAERLIMTFDISGTGQDTTSILPDSTPQRPTPPPITGVVCDLLSFTAAVHEDHCATRQICAQNGMVRSVNYAFMRVWLSNILITAIIPSAP